MRRVLDRKPSRLGVCHHEEAIACFKKALEADPSCAMAHWGVAYAAGPNDNYPWELQDPAGKFQCWFEHYQQASRTARERMVPVLGPARLCVR
jgi:hypothetical protein